MLDIDLTRPQQALARTGSIRSEVYRLRFRRGGS